MIFDETTLRKLNQLTLVASRVRAGGIQGDRRSTKRGSSVEFADYRNYTPGDDLRRLDWNIYARLDRPFVKLFEEEEDLSVTILLDGSRSMDWPPSELGRGAESEQHKFNYALRLTAGLGAVALDAGDQLSVVFLQDGRVAADFGPSRGQASLARLFGFLEELRPAGQTDLNAALRQALVKPRRPGLVILISDLLFLVSVLNLVTMSLPGPYTVVWAMAFILFIFEILLAVSFDGEDRFRNLALILLMYFTYCQFWIYLVVKAFYLDYIKREKRSWDKTVRFEVREEHNS